MRTFNPGPEYSQIISHLLTGKSAREIGRIMGYKSGGTVSKKIKRLINHGYLINHTGPDNRFYSITLKGYSILGNKWAEESSTQSGKVEALVENSDKFYRLHALQIKYWLKTPLPAENIHIISFKDHPTHLRNLRNHSDLIVEFKDFNVTVSTRAIKFTNLEVRMPYKEVYDPHTLLTKAMDLIEPEVEHIESLLSKHIPGLKLRRLANNVLDAIVTRGEIAIENDELAINVGKIQKDTGEKLRIYDPDDGKISEIVDFSKGPAEFESVHPKKLIENLEIYKQFLDDLNSGEFYDRINKIVEVQEKTMQIQEKQEEIQKNAFSQFDERINEHLNLVNNLATQFFHALDELKNYMMR